MNGNYYQNPTFPTAFNPNVVGEPTSIIINEDDVEESRELMQNESNLENILNNNLGNNATVFCSFPNSNDLKDKQFKGIIEKFEKDYLVISDLENKKWHVIQTIYLNYISFEEKINF